MPAAGGMHPGAATVGTRSNVTDVGPVPATAARVDAGSGDGAAVQRDARSAGAAVAPPLGAIAAASPEGAARAFDDVIRRMPAAPSALPMSWRPLATAVIGQQRVRVSTNTGSRAALAAAGKVAATTGDTIHLARPLAGPADAPLLAHELTHVAAPSPRPRFFDDDRDSPEERRAEAIAAVIRRSPVLPRPAAGGSTPSVLGRTAPVISRHRAAPAPAPSPGTTSADDLVQRLAGGPGSDQRSGGSRGSGHSVGSGPAPTAPGPRRAPTTIQRTPGVLDAPPAVVPGEGSSAPSSSSSGGAAPASTSATSNQTLPLLNRQLDTSGLLDLADWIIEQIEDRIDRELDRRGGRYRGGF